MGVQLKDTAGLDMTTLLIIVGIVIVITIGIKFEQMRQKSEEEEMFRKLEKIDIGPSSGSAGGHRVSVRDITSGKVSFPDKKGKKVLKRPAQS